MFAIPGRIAAPIALVAACVLSACRGDADNSALNQDSTLARDLARAGVDSASQPQLQDVPAATPDAPAAAATRPRRNPPAPRRTSPPPAPPANPPATEPTPPVAGGTTVTKSEAGSERPLGTIPGGTTLSLVSSEKVCTNTSKVGDRFSATVHEAVTGANGAVIPAGSRVTVELTQLHGSRNANDKIVMGFRVVSITIGDRTYHPEADVVTAEITRVRTTSGGEDAKKVLGGAVAGAIIGQVLGRDRKGTLIGAAAGAAAGGAAAAASGDYEGCVNQGAAIAVKLNNTLTIATGG
jgi:hypothetical protein